MPARRDSRGRFIGSGGGVGKRTGVTNFKSIERTLNALAKQIPRETMGRVVKVLALHALRGVVEVSPVDTGRLRAGWLVTHGVPSTQVPSAGSHPTAAAIIGVGATAIEQADPFGKTWITNNVPYVEVYEAGRFRPRNPGPSKRDGVVRISGGFHVSTPRGFLFEAGVRIRNALRSLR